MIPYFPHMKYLAAIAAAVALMPVGAIASDVTEYVVEAPFEEVRQDLGDAVVNRGYKIDYEAYIGQMLDRTSADVGGKKKIYENAEFIQFCSAVLSREVMEADPANIAYCPYVLFAYELADDPGNIHVGFRQLSVQGNHASEEALGKINELLDEIAREAADQ